MRFIDVSNLQPTLTPDRLNALWGAGIRGVCVGLQYPGPQHPSGNAHENLAALDADGRFVVTAYLENTPLASVISPLLGDPHVPAARLQRMPWIAVAVEEGSGFEDEPVVRAQLNQIAGLGGPEAWIYSSPYEFQVLGIAATFPGVKGWCADYDGNPDNPGAAFGGCTIAGKQYSDDGQIDGLGFPVDLSEIEEVDVLTYTTLDQSADIEAIKSAVQAIGGQDGQFIALVTGGYTPKPGNKAILMEVKA